jgi:endonuclease YncB( thermonuclease family)
MMVQLGRDRGSLLFLIALFLFFPLLVAAGPVSKMATVIYVVDGDTVLLEFGANGGMGNVRLRGIDSPERQGARFRSGQPYGEQAAEALKRFLVRGARVRVEIFDEGGYGRDAVVIHRQGYVFINDKNINRSMVRSGDAWFYSEEVEGKQACSPYCQELQQDEQEAKREEKGVWATRNPQAPWVWRKQYYATQE